jgi:hypothetical protein
MTNRNGIRAIFTNKGFLENNQLIVYEHIFVASGMTNTDDSRFFVRSPVDIGDDGILEEMCETLILAIVMILWKGIVDSDDAAWTVCYFSNSICFCNI